MKETLSLLSKLFGYTTTLHLVHYFIFLSPMSKEADEMVRRFSFCERVKQPYVLTRSVTLLF